MTDGLQQLAPECISGGIMFDTGWVYGTCEAIRSISISACCMGISGCQEPPVVDEPFINNVRDVCCGD